MLGIIGSLFAALYTKVTRIAPEKASELATAILDIGERIEHAVSLDALEALQDELETALRGAVIGLRDGTISKDGLDTFKLGYEFVRDELGMRRESLKRPAAALDDNVVIVKTAQSACRDGSRERSDRLSPSITPPPRSRRPAARALISAILRLSAACRGSGRAAARASAIAPARSDKAAPRRRSAWRARR